MYRNLRAQELVTMKGVSTIFPNLANTSLTEMKNLRIYKYEGMPTMRDLLIIFESCRKIKFVDLPAGVIKTPSMWQTLLSIFHLNSITELKLGLVVQFDFQILVIW